MSTITAPETTADREMPAEPAPGRTLASRLVAGPAWGPRRPALPSADSNPDEPLTGTIGAPGGAAASASPAQDPASIRALFKGRATTYAKIAGTLFKAVGGVLNGSAAAAAGADTDAWLPDDDDLDTVPPPLGRLAARRIKIGADPDQLNDIEDIGMAAVGLLVWAAKGLVAVAEARRYKRKLEADRAVHTDAGDGQ